MVYTRLFDGSLKVDKIRMMGTNRSFTVTELGRNTPRQSERDAPRTWDTSWPKSKHWVMSGWRHHTLESNLLRSPPGYEEPKQMVFCDFYPATTDGGRNDFESLREAIEKLSLTTHHSPLKCSTPTLGFGFRCASWACCTWTSCKNAWNARGKSRSSRPPHRVTSRPQGWQPTGDPQPDRPPRRQCRRSHP